MSLVLAVALTVHTPLILRLAHRFFHAIVVRVDFPESRKLLNEIYSTKSSDFLIFIAIFAMPFNFLLLLNCTT